VSVFITDGDQRAALALVRALGREGISVTVGSTGENSLAGSSRYCARQVCYPSPQTQAAAFQACLRAEMQQGQFQVLLPLTDITMRVVAQMRGTLPPLVQVPIPSEDKIQEAQDKRHVLMLAKELGIACPETFMLSDDENLAEVARKVHYPVVIKPRFSWWHQNGTWSSGNVQYAHDPEDLVSKYHNSNQLIPGPLVQERIAGEGRGVFLLSWNGELKAAFCHRRLREKPPWGGVSVYRESIPLDQGLVDKSFALLQAIGWQGPAMVEFKIDSRTGEPNLMEVNGRFWGSLQLAIDAGINFPFLFYQLVIGKDPPATFDYKAGVKSRWLLGDLDHLLIRLSHAEKTNGFSRYDRSKLRTCLDFMKLYERDLHYEIFRFDDRGPGWYEWKAYLHSLFRKSGSHREVASAR